MNLNEMTKTELRKEVSKIRSELIRFRLRKAPFTSMDYENYSMYYIIRNEGYKVVSELRNRGLSIGCQERINAFSDQSYKAEKMLENLLDF